jgi:hypothetical protein
VRERSEVATFRQTHLAEGVEHPLLNVLPAEVGELDEALARLVPHEIEGVP